MKLQEIKRMQELAGLLIENENNTLEDSDNRKFLHIWNVILNDDSMNEIIKLSKINRPLVNIWNSLNWNDLSNDEKKKLIPFLKKYENQYYKFISNMKNIDSSVGEFQSSYFNPKDGTIDRKKALNYLKQFNNDEVDAKSFIEDDEGLPESELNGLEDIRSMSDKDVEDFLRMEMSYFYFLDPDSI